MKNTTGAALAAMAIFAGSTLLSSSLWAEEAEFAANQEISTTGTGDLQRALEARAEQDAEAIAAGAMTAATNLDLAVSLDLEKRPAGHTSVLLVSEL